jgi:hypothetical protein
MGWAQVVDESDLHLYAGSTRTGGGAAGLGH